MPVAQAPSAAIDVRCAYLFISKLQSKFVSNGLRSSIASSMLYAKALQIFQLQLSPECFL